MSSGLISVKRQRLLESFVQQIMSETEIMRSNASLVKSIDDFLNAAVDALHKTDFRNALIKTRQIVHCCLSMIEDGYGLSCKGASFADRIASITQKSPLNTFYKGPTLPYAPDNHLQVMASLDQLRKVGNAAAHEENEMVTDAHHRKFFDILCHVMLLVSIFSRSHASNNQQGGSLVNNASRENSASKRNNTSNNKSDKQQKIDNVAPVKLSGKQNPRPAEDKKGNSNKVDKDARGVVTNKNVQAVQDSVAQLRPCKKHPQMKIAKVFWIKQSSDEAQIVWSASKQVQSKMGHMQIKVDATMCAKTQDKLIKFKADTKTSHTVQIKWQCSKCKQWSELSDVYHLKSRSGKKLQQSDGQPAASKSSEIETDDGASEDEASIEQLTLNSLDNERDDVESDNEESGDEEQDSTEITASHFDKDLPAIETAKDYHPTQPTLNSNALKSDVFTLVSVFDGKVLTLRNGNISVEEPLINAPEQMWTFNDGFLSAQLSLSQVLDICGFSVLQAVYKFKFDVICYEKKAIDNNNQRWIMHESQNDTVIFESMVGAYALASTDTDDKVVAQTINKRSLRQQWRMHPCSL
ncbi:hypothetical protein MP228_006094 [Amoeboaphelidium protococcarum]|nr:hypothetical protein MP228_006094 [Amoeboaphelidium protococcarum]